MGEVLRLVSNHNPTYAYQYCDRWLRALLSTNITNLGPITKSSQIYLELGKVINIRCKTSKNSQRSIFSLNSDAVQWALDAVLSRLATQEELNPVLNPGLELLKLCLDYSTEDPLLLSVLLSCISSLFVVVTVTPAALHPTLNCIFKCITFSNSNSNSEEIKALRRHGCALMVKIATRHPTTLVPVFDHLRQTIVDDLFIKSKALFKMEFVTLVEGLVLISNEFQNFDVQSRFIETLAKPVCDKLKSLEPHFLTPQAFSTFVGLDGSKDCSEQRSEVSFCLHFLVSLLRRVAVPNDLLKCRISGFVDSTVTEVLAIRNPAGVVGCHVLSTILKLTKTFIDLFNVRNVYPKVFDMLDFEKAVVQGQSAKEADSNSDNGDNSDQAANAINEDTTKKLQMFAFEQFENLFHILAQFCSR